VLARLAPPRRRVTNQVLTGPAIAPPVCIVSVPISHALFDAI
jgi:hypothetical protein